ncbi:hypothetical protein [Glycomyces sp. MUSA5-2]|uniref:hypothetical protein n=1 Tax=Glycomyces sp. MUSA5-2 TaxID=2053002 RepID=UPI0030085ACF
MVGDILDAIFDWLVEMLRDTSASLIEALLAAGMLALPPWVTQSTAVINERFRIVVVTCYALVVCVGALMIMGSDNLQFTYSAREIVPRLVAGFCLALMSWEIVTSLASINNSIVVALLLGDSDAEIPSDASSVSGALDMLMLSYDLTSMVFVELAVQVLRIIAIIMLFICMFTRNIAWFMVCVLAPAALAAHGLPSTEGAAFLWWRMTVACMASSLGQAWILWVWDTLFEGLSDSAVLLNYPLEPLYALVLVWLIWRVHKSVFLWARGRPTRIPGARLLKAAATALVVGAVMRSNPVGALASRVPGFSRFANHLTRGRFSKVFAKGAQRPSEQQAASQSGNYSSSTPWRMRTNTKGPNGATKLHTHGPGQASCPHCAPVGKSKPSPSKRQPGGKPSGAGQQRPRKGQAKRADRAGNGKSPKTPPKSGSPKPSPQGTGTLPQASGKRYSHPPHQLPPSSRLGGRPLPPDRRPKWETPPARGEGKAKPKWQDPPQRRPGYRKGKS